MFLKSRKVLILLTTLGLSVNSQVGAKPTLELRPEIPPKRYGGTLVIGHNNPPTIINPILTDSSVSASVMTLVFNRLD